MLHWFKSSCSHSVWSWNDWQKRGLHYICLSVLGCLDGAVNSSIIIYLVLLSSGSKRVQGPIVLVTACTQSKRDCLSPGVCSLSRQRWEGKQDQEKQSDFLGGFTESQWHSQDKNPGPWSDVIHYLIVHIAAQLLLTCWEADETPVVSALIFPQLNLT